MWRIRRLPSDVLAELSASPAESQAVNRLVDRRLLFECAVTHYAAINATPDQLDELDRLTRDMAESSDWSDYDQADEQFHQLVGTASGLGTALEVYHEALAELYAYFIPYPIELLHSPTATTWLWWQPCVPATRPGPWRSPANTWISCTGRCLWGWRRAGSKPPFAIHWRQEPSGRLSGNIDGEWSVPLKAAASQPAHR
ncbi:FCD domain-containing protein [Arthrobacter sp. R4]|uniref:FCD domain-containing protein n=1 Tax=Arthrobacter sp. R4 TaxID=644417 RepID=UPI003ED93A29